METAIKCLGFRVRAWGCACHALARYTSSAKLFMVIGYRGYIGVNIGIMEKTMETTIMGYIGVIWLVVKLWSLFGSLL